MRDQSFLPHAHLFDLGCVHPAAVLLISVATWEAHGNDLNRGAHSLNLSGPFKVGLKKKKTQVTQWWLWVYSQWEATSVSRIFSADLRRMKERLGFKYAGTCWGNTSILINFYPLLWTSSGPHFMRKSQPLNAGCGLRLVPKVEHCRRWTESLFAPCLPNISFSSSYFRSPSLRRTHDMRVRVTIFKCTSRYDWYGSNLNHLKSFKWNHLNNLL